MKRVPDMISVASALVSGLDTHKSPLPPDATAFTPNVGGVSAAAVIERHEISAAIMQKKDIALLVCFFKIVTSLFYDTESLKIPRLLIL
jgi:hypothetical protein